MKVYNSESKVGPDKTGGLPILMSFLSSFNLALACLLAAPS